MAEDVTIVGVVLRSFAIVPDSYKKVRKNCSPDDLISVAQLEALGASVKRWIVDQEASFENERREEMETIRARVTVDDLAEALGDQIRLSFGQVHDYRAFAAQIKQNIVRQLERRFPRQSLEAQLSAADHEITAIYWASELMITKLEAVYVLQDRDALREYGQHGKTKFHSLFLKYLRIYQHSFDNKSVNVVLSGNSHSHVVGNMTAAGLIPQGLIDNALKYSPAGTAVKFAFEDDGTDLRFSVESYGPIIDPDEKSRIFEPFYRGRHAQDAEGTGVGLALVAMAADQLDATLAVTQDRTDKRHELVRTTFSVCFDLAAAADDR